MAQSLKQLTDPELTNRVKLLVQTERENLSHLLEHLAEFDERKIAVAEGFSSLFDYCTRELLYCEGAAYRRIHAARAAARFPIIYKKLADGDIHLSGVTSLAQYLTKENHLELLELAKGKTRREIDFLLVRLVPRHVPKDSIRRVFPHTGSLSDWHAPAANGNGSAPTPSIQPHQPPWSPAADPARGAALEVILPLTPECVRFSFVGAPQLLSLLERSREVLKHKYPSGKIEDIFREALELLLDKKDPQRQLKLKDQKTDEKLHEKPEQNKTAKEPPANTATRYIPKSVREEVVRRDRSQCAYVGSKGRCPQKAGLNIDHIVPWSKGGRSDTAANLRLLCTVHNLDKARRDFGPRKEEETG